MNTKEDKQKEREKVLSMTRKYTFRSLLCKKRELSSKLQDWEVTTINFLKIKTNKRINKFKKGLIKIYTPKSQLVMDEFRLKRTKHSLSRKGSKQEPQVIEWSFSSRSPSAVQAYMKNLQNIEHEKLFSAQRLGQIHFTVFFSCI